MRCAGLAVLPWCVLGHGLGPTGGVGWRHVGNSAIESGPLPSLGHGPGGSGLVLNGRIQLVRENGFRPRFSRPAILSNGSW